MTAALDKYDAAYRRGYQDGLEGRPSRPPADDSAVNYHDGYDDGDFKRVDEGGEWSPEVQDDEYVGPGE